jgi:hypothetical protein
MLVSAASSFVPRRSWSTREAVRHGNGRIKPSPDLRWHQFNQHFARIKKAHGVSGCAGRRQFSQLRCLSRLGNGGELLWVSHHSCVLHILLGVHSKAPGTQKKKYTMKIGELDWPVYHVVLDRSRSEGEPGAPVTTQGEFPSWRLRFPAPVPHSFNSCSWWMLLLVPSQSNSLYSTPIHSC